MKFLLLSFSFLFMFRAQAAPANITCQDIAKASAQGNAGVRLKNFYDTYWKYLMTTYPEWATYKGYPGQNDRWTDRSLEILASREKMTICLKDVFKKIPRASLKDQDKLHYDLSMQRFEMAIEGQQFQDKYLVVDQLGGPHMDVADMLVAMPKTNKKDYEDMLARLEKYPTVLAQSEVLLREGVKNKITPVKMFLQKVPGQFDPILTKNVEVSPLYKPFKDITISLTAEEKTALQTKAKSIISNTVFPSLTKFKEYLEKEYIPYARDFIAFTQMPNGQKWYAYNVKDQTTTKMTPEEIHEIGLKEVARIKVEMEKVKDGVGFRGDLQKFNQFLLQDSQFYYTKADDLIAGYRDISKRIDAELPKLFKTLPRLTYGVRAMPAYKEKEAPTAYYMGGSLEAGRPGYFEANTYDLKARPKWGMEALTLHEAVPGHHLQIAIAQELEEKPEVLKSSGYTAFVEGWALYAEGLGEEVGFYKDPYSKYGQLSYEMWRAVRLVVDTGMHMKGWSRDQAIEYFKEHVPKTTLEAEVEVDRYITWPGQALAYKIGQLKIRELREKATATLGAKFNVRTFHDEILKNGAVPLDVLEKNIGEWLKKETQQRNRKQT